MDKIAHTLRTETPYGDTRDELFALPMESNSPVLPTTIEFDKDSNGCPTYQKTFCSVVYRMALLGATQADICTAFGITPEVFKTWRDQHPEFDLSFRRGGKEADSHVAHALYKRAIGYNYPEVKHYTSNGIVTDERVVMKHEPPDVKAITFWLKNRTGGQWQDEVRIASNETAESKLSTSELTKLLTAAGLVKANTGGQLDSLEVKP
jgi:hypothetical protein